MLSQQPPQISIAIDDLLSDSICATGWNNEDRAAATASNLLPMDQEVCEI